MIQQNITIVVHGKTEEDCEDAFHEAVRRINDGNVAGSDHNDDGGFYFNIENILEGD